MLPRTVMLQPAAWWPALSWHNLRPEVTIMPWILHCPQAEVGAGEQSVANHVYRTLPAA